MVDEYGYRNEDDYTTFEIFVSNDLAKQDVCISIRIDGTFIGRYFLGLGQNVLPGLYVSECVTKPFRFRELNIPDDQTLRDPQRWKWENMGLMEFCVYRCVKKSREKFKSDYIQPANDNPIASSQASAHSVSTGPERPIPRIEGVQGVTLDPPDQPFARMIFRYRPRETLQAQGVMSDRSSLPPISSHTSPVSPTTMPPWSSNNMLRQVQLPPPTNLLQRAQTRRFPASAELQLPSRARFSPYSRPNTGVRVPSRAHSMPESSQVARSATIPPREQDSMDEELSSIKASALDTTGILEASMRQLHLLQRQLDLLEARRQRTLAPPIPQPQTVKAEPHTPEDAEQGPAREASTPTASPVLQWP
ncbi:hypothetical protein NM688_g5787 [Phlebia brevispora]|uniref:Uncharacterized protein n=1 Tax=Phlebia brevispora TaxID=194682 RepID=A0ACC1SPX9_9APHY|nr:hypothetical protein NM688_g5787 [Phlebia brevispora]